MGTFIACLCIASVLWIVHTLNGNYKYKLGIPVKFVNLPNNKLIIGELPEKLEIDIKASGLKLLFIRLKKTQDPVTIDFNSLKTNAKSQAYSISNGNFNLKSAINFDVEILKIRPDTLFFSSQKSNSRLLPVKPNLQASFAPGYSIVSRPTVNPAFITVTSDDPELNLMDTIYTQPIHLKDVAQNYTTTIGLKKTSASLNYNVKTVQVSFTVDRLIEASVIVPVQIMNKTSDEKVKLLPEVVTIKYLVAMKEYDTIDPSLFKATVNFSDIVNREKTLEVDLTRAPSEIKILRIEPASISYLIYK